MTEHKINLSIDDLTALAEPVNREDLRDGSSLEARRVGKDVEAILHFTLGSTSSDPSVISGIALVREEALELSAKLRSIHSANLMGKLDCGNEIAEAYDKLLVKLDYLIDLLDADSLDRVERAFLTS